MPNVYFDFETRSCIDLKKFGAAVYSRDESTEIMSCVFRHEDGTQIIWTPNCPYELPMCNRSSVLPATVRGWIADGCHFVAHNCEMFDAMIWQEKIPGELPIFRDTLHTARLAGLPGKLDDLLFAILGKHKGDSSAMKVLTASRYVGTPPKPMAVKGNKTLWQKLIKYNIADVEDLEVLHNTMSAMNEDIPGLIELHWEINRRGLLIDTNFTRDIIEAFKKIGDLAAKRVRAVAPTLCTDPKTGKEIPIESVLRSPARIKKYLASIGIELPGDSLNKKNVEEWLIRNTKHKRYNDASVILIGRQAVCRAAIGKMARVLQDVDPRTSRMYRWANYHGAGTGRFSGRGIQPHNFSRNKVKTFPTTRPDVRAIRDADLLSGLTRSIIRPSPGKKFYIGDYSQIEARNLACLAGCHQMLDVFRSGEDLYCTMASSVYGRPITKEDETERQVGKVVILGCGYQMSANKFGEFCLNARVNLEAAGVTAEYCVSAFRETFWQIPKLWYEFQKSALAAFEDYKTYTVGRCQIYMEDSKWFIIQLPSGRKLRYYKPRVMLGEYGPQLEYWSYRGFYKTLYGGMEVENVVQACSRDILCDGMVRSSHIADPVIHVHDEVAFESARDVKHDLEEVLNTSPTWLPDVPLKIEVFKSDVYSKSPVRLRGVRRRDT